MSVSDAVLSYLRVLIWPALICVLAFGFRSTIRSLLRVRLRQIDAPGFSAKFDEVAQDAKRLVQSGQPKGTSLPPRSATERRAEHFTPQSYTDAREIGEAFRAGHPVIVDLTQMDNRESVRLIDFSAGLIFMGRGSIDRLRSKVYALVPEAFLDHEKSGHRESAPSAPK
jgi:hypothetical protein